MLAVLLVLGAAGALGRLLAFAAVHLAIAIGVTAAIAMLVVILAALVVLGVVRMSRALLRVALVPRTMLPVRHTGIAGVAAALLMSLMGGGGLRGGRRDEGKSRGCGDEKLFHVIIS